MEHFVFPSYDDWHGCEWNWKQEYDGIWTTEIKVENDTPDDDDDDESVIIWYEYIRTSEWNPMGSVLALYKKHSTELHTIYLLINRSSIYFTRCGQRNQCKIHYTQENNTAEYLYASDELFFRKCPIGGVAE